MSGRVKGWLVAALATLWLAGSAGAATWGGITPGETIRRDVEARYGRPTNERVVVEEGRTGSEWTYAGDRAPRGLERMVVGFGLVRPQGFAPEVVRSVTLFPKPRAFSVMQITAGWGKPDAIGTDESTGRPAMRYDMRGLVIVLDKSGQWAEFMLFGPERKP